MRTLICYSVTQESDIALSDGGPRRDIRCLIERLGATVLYSDGRAAKGPRWLNRLVGPHVRHAWVAAGKARDFDIVFADGEHVGLPLLFFLPIRKRRRTRVFILGHFVDRWWKKLLLRAGSRLVPNGVLIVHSSVQARVAQASVSHSWLVQLLPYQVDTQFWVRRARPTNRRPLVVAVGSEHRDYATLAQAVGRLDVDVCIAAGSHWARSHAPTGTLHGNVKTFEKTLSFSELRDLYTEADLVVVPLQPVSNQSGVTVMLEAMSMSCPVVVTATLGQLEVVTGPLVRASGFDQSSTAHRGPQLFSFEPDSEPTGWYVNPHDVSGLRAAIQSLVEDPLARERLGAAARASVENSFRVDQFAERFASLIEAHGDVQ